MKKLKYNCIVTDQKGERGIMFDIEALNPFLAFDEAKQIGQARIGTMTVLTSVSEARNDLDSGEGE